VVEKTDGAEGKCSGLKISVIASPTFFVFVGRGNPEKTKSVISLKSFRGLFGFFLDCRARKSVSLAMTG
jgi:hypothetical protein